MPGPNRRRDFCTYFDHRYLLKGLALHESLQRHGGAFRLFVLALTPECESALAELALPGVRVVPLADLEASDPELAAVRPHRSTVEYYFTATPSWMRHLFARFDEIETLTYLDADLFFFSSPEPLHEELGDGCIAIVPHRFPDSHRHLEAYGRYNVSWVAFRRQAEAMRCLERWRADCLEWCFDRAEDGRYADQKYLDAWPERYAGTREILHPGANLAPWNLARHRITPSSEGPRVDGRPLVFFHAHRLHVEPNGTYELDLDDYPGDLDPAVRDEIVAPYSRAVARAGRRIGETRESEALDTARSGYVAALRRRMKDAEVAAKDLGEALGREASGRLRERRRTRRVLESARRRVRDAERREGEAREASANEVADLRRVLELEQNRAATAAREAEALELDLGRERGRAHEAFRAAEDRLQVARTLEREISRLRDSRSWRWTAWLRRLGAILVRERPSREMATSESAAAHPTWSGRETGEPWATRRALRPATLPDGSPWPRISIVTPSFQQGRFLEAAIRSVLDQGYPEVEHIVVDGASTDETEDVLDRYGDRLARVVREPDRGQSHALNKGFALATGEILTWLNADDELAPGALAAVAVAFAASGAEMVAGICELHEGGRVVHRHLTSCDDGPLPLAGLLDLAGGWNAGAFFYQPEVFFRRELWERAGASVREDLHFSMDYELWLRFALAGARLKVIGRPIARYRRHEQQKTADRAAFEPELESVRREFLEAHPEWADSDVRPAGDDARRLRVALVNDVGELYGAGIAHGRLGAALRLAGHTTRAFVRSDHASDDELLAAVGSFAADVALVGNLHGAPGDGVRLVGELSRSRPTYWVLHDLWPLTGRCAYPQECERHLVGCDESCPTADEYPALEPSAIPSAWREKAALHASGRVRMIGYSEWAVEFARTTLRSVVPDRAPRVSRIRLGVPTERFRPFDRMRARRHLGLPERGRVILFCAPSVGDRRKGAELVARAVARAALSELTLLVVGNLDAMPAIEGVARSALGFVDDPGLLAVAYSAADLVLGASAEETLGQVFLEAAACGTPSLAFGLTGVRDAVAPGWTGRWAAPRSAEALAAALRDAFADPAALESLGRTARLYCENEWSLEASARSLVSAFRRDGLVDRRGLTDRLGFRAHDPREDGEIGPRVAWLGVDGVGPPEGPFPEHGMPERFRWCSGSSVRLLLFAEGTWFARVEVRYDNVLHDVIHCTVESGGQRLADAALPRTSRGLGGRFEFELELELGANEVVLRFDHTASPTREDPRALTVALRDVAFSVAGDAS